MRLKKPLNCGEHEMYFQYMYEKDYEEICKGPGNFPDLKQLCNLQKQVE